MRFLAFAGFLLVFPFSCLFLLAATQLELKFKISSCFCLFCLVLACFGCFGCLCCHAAASCCLLLLFWSWSSNSVLAFACCSLLGHALAPWSMELILNLDSSWLYCLLWLPFGCFSLLWLALACFGCFGLLWLALAALAALPCFALHWLLWLLWLALACLGCFGCLRFPFHCYSGLWGGLGSIFRIFSQFFRYFDAS